MLSRNLLIACCLAVMPLQALSATTIVFGIHQIDYEPYQKLVNGEPVGPDIDLVREMFSRMDEYDLELAILPAKRGVVDMQRGNIDLLSMFPSAFNFEFALFPEIPLHVSHYKLAVMKGQEFNFERIEDLYQRRIGVVRSNPIGEEFEAAVGRGLIQAQVNENWNTLVYNLTSRRVTAIAGNERILTIAAERMDKINKITFLPKPISSRGMALAVSKHSKRADPQLLLARLEATMRAMMKDGAWNAILARHSEPLL